MSLIKDLFKKKPVVCECVKCSHKWSPRKAVELIQECPGCKNRNWRKTP